MPRQRFSAPFFERAILTLRGVARRCRHANGVTAVRVGLASRAAARGALGWAGRGWKRPAKALTAAVVLVLVMVLVAMSAVSRQRHDAPVVEAKPKPPKVGVLPERMTATSTTRRNKNGSFTTTIYSSPVNYRDAKGTWRRIDPTLHPDGTGGYAWRSGANSYTARFKSRLDGAYTEFGRGGSLFRTTAVGASAVPGRQSGARVSYSGAYPGADLTYAVGPTGVKEVIDLAGPDSPASYSFRISYTGKGNPQLARRPDGSYRVSVAGVRGPAFVLNAPTVTESARGRQAATPDAGAKPTLAVVAQGKDLLVTLAVDAGWLRAPGRAFPVHLDPTMTVSNDVDDASFSAGSTALVNSGDYLPIGADTKANWRSALQFDFYGLPTGAQVTDAKLGLYYDGTCIVASGKACVSTAHTIDAHRITSYWDSYSSTGSSITYDTTVVGSYTQPAAAAPGWMTWPATSAVQSWLSGATTNFGLLLKQHTETLSTGGPSPVSGWNFTAPYDQMPKLDLTYNEDGGALAAPATVHANGADLSWSRYTGTTSGDPFGQYEVHRIPGSTDFTPSASTLLATIRDQSITMYRDTTAAPGKAFTYKIVTNGSASYPQTVTTPASGQARKTLQPDDVSGQTSEIDYSPGALPGDCTGYGTSSDMYVGADSYGKYHGLLRFDLRDIPQTATVTSASASVWEVYGPSAQVTVEAHRLTRGWSEGTDDYLNCDGATWDQAQAGALWTAKGSDVDPTVAASVVVPAGDQTVARTFAITGLVQNWINGSQPNHGIMLRTSDESLVDYHYVDFASDDWYDSPTQRPSLTVTYSDGSVAAGPSVSVSAPGPGATISGSTVALSAAASDDGKVSKVEFLVDGTVVGTDTAAPYQVTWNSASVINGAHSVTARATDDAGIVTTSAAVSATVDNTAPPTSALSAPLGGSTVSGSVTVSANATDDKGVASVAFLVDGVQVGAPDTTAPYSITWNTADPLAPVYNGSHQMTAAATDTSGQVTVSTAVSVTANNTGATTFKAGFTLNNPTDLTDDAFPTSLTENTAAGVPVQDPYAGTTNPDGTSGGSLGRSLSSAPHDDMGAPPATCPANAYCPTVNVTNTSGSTWTSSGAQVWYRWYAPNGAIMYEGKSSTGFPATFAANAVQSFPLVVYPPALPPGVQQGTFNLRIDVWDPATSTWFSGKGNPPPDNPVIVAKALATKLGLEKFYQYDGEALGAGASQLVNVANGDLLVRWSPFFSPGRGLSTLTDLTYNSLEDHSSSPAGNNFSLSISGLARLGEPIDIHPNKADTISGRSNKWIEVTDGDGTTHHFDGTTGSDGITRWTEPAGVNLYLRSLTGDPNRVWAFTRPDKVTYYFDADGFPTSVEDRNGNKITYVYQDTPSGEDPGGPKKRIIQITDPAGRNFQLAYWSKAEIKKAHVRGKIKTITDHSGSVLKFDYYDDGNLLRLTQVGGTNADGSFLADRSMVFTYTTSKGDGPAIGADGSTGTATRRNPDAKTPNESTRLYSVIDPLGNETRFAYYLATDGPQLRWKLKSHTDRDGLATTYAYDLTNRVTTVTDPLARATKYSYDTSGRITSIVNPKNETTGVSWTGDNKVSKVTFASGKFTTYTYNANGYLLTNTDELSRTTALTYQDQAVDANDSAKHLSLLATVTKPRGVATTTVAGDYMTSYSYDTAGNVDKVTDPTGAVTDYDYNLAGSANPGTIAAIHDANGNPATTYPSYDPSGQPTKVVDPLGRTTTTGYDADGHVVWLQDPIHASATGSDTRAFRSYFDYDSFGRLGRQSAPKSTGTDRGTLLWSSVSFDANDNTVRSVAPHYGPATTDPGTGAVTTTTFDTMDRPTLITGPDTSADPAGERTKIDYDAAGRTSEVTKPRGVQTSTVTDDFATVYTYDVLDRVTKKTQYGTSTAQSRVTQMCYDVAGDLRSITSPRAGSATITCPGDGPASAAPFTTEMDYDAAHQQITQRDELGHTQSTEYDLNGNVTAHQSDIATGRVKRTEVDYDQRDKPITQRERFDGATGRNATTRYEYDANGNQTRAISPRGSDAGGVTGPWTSYVTVNAYDAVNELIKTTLPFDSRDGTERQYQHRSYDANGRLTSLSLPVTQSDPAQVGSTAKTDMTYFDPGWIRTSDDPANPMVHFDYTAQGQQSKRTPEKKASPGTLDADKQMTWEYYPDQMLKSRKDQGGQPSTYTYDADNNLISSVDNGVTDPNEHAVETKSTFTGYDEVGKTSHHKQGDAVWKFTDYTYDDNGNVTVRRENGEEDSAGTQSTAPRRFELTYDGADWLTQQLDLGTDSACKDDSRTVNTFWGTGWEKQRDVYRAGATCTSDPTTWPKKQTTTWTHFDNGKLRTMSTTNGAGTVTESHDVGYFDSDNYYVDGNRTKDHYVLKRGTGSTATTCLAATPCDAAWTYDARDRLLTEQLRAGKTNTYTLDEPSKLIGDTTIRAGNVTTQVKDGQATTQRYTGNQLTDVTAGGVTGKYWYDDQGNQDCLTLAAGSQADCSPGNGATPTNLVTDWSYDYLNRLGSVRQYTGSTKTDESDYTYDALDRTSKETETHNNSQGNNRTTDFTYQGLSALVTEEKQSGGTNPKTKSYSYDNYGHKIGMTDKDNNTGTTNSYTYGTDVHGSISQLIDDAGNVKASYGYTAYGAADSTSTDPESLTSGDTNAQAPLNPMRYSGKRTDSGTATSPTAQPDYDMGARRYGPTTGRFLQGDAFANSLSDLGLALDPLTQNRYALAGGNPVSYVETDGHMLMADGGGGGSTTPNPTSSSLSNTIKSVGKTVRDIGKNVWEDVRDKWPLQLADTLQGAVIGGLAAKHIDILKQESARLMQESKQMVEWYKKAPGGSNYAEYLNKESFRLFMESDKYARRASSLTRSFGSKLPLVGAAITAASIGYDIHNGKPAGKAVISGVGGAVAAGVTGAAVGTAIGGPVGTVVGFGVGAAVGLVTSGALDKGYDMLPKGVQEGIEKPFDAAGDVASDIGSGVKDAWNSIF